MQDLVSRASALPTLPTKTRYRNQKHVNGGDDAFAWSRLKAFSAKSSVAMTASAFVPPQGKPVMLS
jgi:hypothetical protein